MQDFICTTCGIQYEPANLAPSNCPICEDERQYVNPAGQTWTSLEQVNRQQKNIIEAVTPDVYAIYSTPSFAIGQRAHLVISPAGNILWDCITNIDNSTIQLVNALGGINAIAISHPHFFSTIVEWSKALGNAPVYINRKDQQWLGRSSAGIQLWDEELSLWNGIKLICCGGHFPGSAVMHVPAIRALFVGDTIQVCPDRKTVSFMYSYPNLIPLPEKDILQIESCIASVEFEVLYGAFGHYLKENAKAAVAFSATRYRKIFK